MLRPLIQFITNFIRKKNTGCFIPSFKCLYGQKGFCSVVTSIMCKTLTVSECKKESGFLNGSLYVMSGSAKSCMLVQVIVASAVLRSFRRQKNKTKRKLVKQSSRQASKINHEPLRCFLSDVIRHQSFITPVNFIGLGRSGKFKA